MLLCCNKCRRTMKGTTAYDGACECGGLITERWRMLRRGDLVRVTKPISATEETLLGRLFAFQRYSKPHGYAVVKDDHGAWWVHPEALELDQ